MKIRIITLPKLSKRDKTHIFVTYYTKQNTTTKIYLTSLDTSTIGKTNELIISDL